VEGKGGASNKKEAKRTCAGTEEKGGCKWRGPLSGREDNGDTFSLS